MPWFPTIDWTCPRGLADRPLVAWVSDRELVVFWIAGSETEYPDIPGYYPNALWSQRIELSDDHTAHTLQPPVEMGGDYGDNFLLSAHRTETGEFIVRSYNPPNT